MQHWAYLWLIWVCFHGLAFGQALHPYKKEGKWGYLNEKAQMVIAPAYQDAKAFSEGLAVVRTTNGFSYINTKGEVVINAKFDWADGFMGGMARVVEKGYFGLIDRKGNWVISARYADSLQLVHVGYGWWRIGWDGREGIIRADGSRFKVDGLQWIDRFVGGFCAVSAGYGKQSYLDRSGKLIAPLQWNLGLPPYGFHEGRARIRVGQKVGYIDTSGKIVIQPKYAIAGDFQKGIARVRVNDFGNWVFIDASGKQTIAGEWPSVTDFSYGLAVAKQEDEWGWINERGAWVISPQYEEVGEWNACFCAYYVHDKGWRFIRRKDGSKLEGHWRDVKPYGSSLWLVKSSTGWGLMDGAGVLRLKPAAQHLIPLDKGRLTYSNNGKWGVVDSNGKVLLPAAYDQVYLAGGLIGVRNDTPLLGYVDKTGKEILPPQFTEAQDFHNGKALVRLPEVFSGRFIDKKGAKLKEVSYQKIGAFGSNLYPVTYQKKTGFMDANGVIKIPCNFDQAEPFSEGLAAASEWRAPDPKRRDSTVQYWGFLNPKGAWAIKPQFRAVSPFSEGISLVNTSAGAVPRWQYILPSGKLAFNSYFAYAEPFRGGTAMVSTATKEDDPLVVAWRVIDKSGRAVLSLAPRQLPLGPFAEERLALDNGHRVGFINKNNEFAIPAVYDADVRAEGYAFNEGLCAAKKDSRWGYIYPTGVWMQEPRYIDALDFENGYARVRTHTGWGAIDATGHMVVQPIYPNLEAFSEGIAVHTNPRVTLQVGYLDLLGRKVWPLTR